MPVMPDPRHHTTPSGCVEDGGVKPPVDLVHVREVKAGILEDRMFGYEGARDLEEDFAAKLICGLVWRELEGPIQREKELGPFPSEPRLAGTISSDGDEACLTNAVIALNRRMPS